MKDSDFFPCPAPCTMSEYFRWYGKTGGFGSKEEWLANVRIALIIAPVLIDLLDEETLIELESVSCKTKA